MLIVLLAAAAPASADLAPSPSAPGPISFAAPAPSSPLARRGAELLGMSVPDLLAKYTEYWDERYLSSIQSPAATRSELNQFLAGDGWLKGAGVAWVMAAEGDAHRSDNLLFGEPLLMARVGTEGPPTPSIMVRAAPPAFSGSANSSRNENGAPVVLAEHKEPWSKSAAAFYRGFVGLSMLAIMLLVWLRDQLRAPSRRTR